MQMAKPLFHSLMSFITMLVVVVELFSLLLSVNITLTSMNQY